MELAHYRLEPLETVSFQNYGEAPFGIGIKLLQRVQTLYKVTEQHLLDFADLGYGITVYSPERYSSNLMAIKTYSLLNESETQKPLFYFIH